MPVCGCTCRHLTRTRTKHIIRPTHSSSTCPTTTKGNSEKELWVKKYIYWYFQKQKQLLSPRGGVWRPLNFYTSGSLKSWIILNLDRYVREDALRWVWRDCNRNRNCYDYSRELWDKLWNEVDTYLRVLGKLSVEIIISREVMWMSSIVTQHHMMITHDHVMFAHGPVSVPLVWRVFRK